MYGEVAHFGNMGHSVCDCLCLLKTYFCAMSHTVKFYCVRRHTKSLRNGPFASMPSHYERLAGEEWEGEGGPGLAWPDSAYLDTCVRNATLANDAGSAALKVSGPFFSCSPLSVHFQHRCFLPRLAHSPTERNQARARACRNVHGERGHGAMA